MLQVDRVAMVSGVSAEECVDHVLCVAEALCQPAREWFLCLLQVSRAAHRFKLEKCSLYTIFVLG